MVDYMIMMLILLLENFLLNYGNVDITEERVPNVYHVLCVRLLGRLLSCLTCCDKGTDLETKDCDLLTAIMTSRAHCWVAETTKNANKSSYW